MSDIDDKEKKQMVQKVFQKMQQQKQKNKWKNCPKGPYSCLFRDKEGDRHICPHAPCKLTRHKIGKNERIIDLHLRNRRYDQAYYFLTDVIDVSQFSCSINKMPTNIDKDNPKYLQQIPAECRIFVLIDHLKETKEQIFQTRMTQMKGQQQDKELSKQGKRRLKNIEQKFRKKVKSIISILRHLSKDQQHKEYIKKKAQKRSLEKIRVCSETNQPYQAQVGAEIDKLHRDDEKVLMPNNQQFQQSNEQLFRKAKQQALQKEVGKNPNQAQQQPRPQQQQQGPQRPPQDREQRKRRGDM